MANTQATFGFKHIGYLGGSAYDMQMTGNYQIQSTNTTKIGFGDPVQKVNATSKYIQQASNATTQEITGIFVGCEFTDSTGQPNRSRRSEVEAAAAGGGRVLRGKRDYLGGAGDGGAS